MPLDLWFRDDVSRILASTLNTLRASSSSLLPANCLPHPPETSLAYLQGFTDALRAIAIAFGLPAPDDTAPRTPPPASRQAWSSVATLPPPKVPCHE